MKKIYMVLLATILIYASSLAQKGNNRIGIGADISIPTSDFGSYFKTGFGGYAKALFGVGKSGQVSFTSGYSNFKATEGVPLTLSFIPLLIGYRANFNGFFVEPQLGYLVIGGKALTPEDELVTGSTGSFMWAAGAGYVFNNKVEISARYQMGSKQGTNLGSFGLRLGYNFSLKGSK